MYVKISKNLSAKYHEENKERLQKKLVKDQNLSKEEKEKKQLVMKVIRISQKRKDKSLLHIE